MAIYAENEPQLFFKAMIYILLQVIHRVVLVKIIFIVTFGAINHTHLLYKNQKIKTQYVAIHNKITMAI